MRLAAVHIQGFKSFRTETTFEFPRDPGLFLILGENRKEKELGSNGAGKSTIFDAVCWCWFGKTSRGTKGPALVNWTGDYLCQVVTDIEGASFGVGKETVSIRRSQNPNSVSITSRSGKAKKVTQEEIDDLLGFGYDAFLSSVLMGQFNPWFFDRSPAERLRVLEESLDLAVYDRAAKLAAAKEKETLEDVSSIRERISRIEGSLNASRSLLRSEKDRRDSWAEKATEARLRAKEDLSRASSEVEAAEEALREAQKTVGNTENIVEDIIRRLSDLQKIEQEERENFVRAEAELGEVRRREKRSKKALDDYPEEGECPTCGQPIGPNHRKKELAKFSFLLSCVVVARKKAEKELERLEERVILARDDRQKVSAKYLRAEKELDEAKKRRARASSDLREAKRSEEAASSFLDREEKSENPHAEAVRNLIRSRKEEKAEKAKLEEEIGRAESLAEVYAFWKGGMKDVRLMVVEDALRELEIHVNSSLVSLGLRKFSVSFEVERAGAGKKIIRGFSTLITGPDSGGPVPWELWSGGETQRLRVAGAIGVSNLVRARLGISLPFEVWDEPTDHLSEEGAEDLLRSFADRVRDEKRQVWFIDHQAPNSGNWDGFRIIRKTSKGSQVIAKEAM